MATACLAGFCGGGRLICFILPSRKGLVNKIRYLQFFWGSGSSFVPKYHRTFGTSLSAHIDICRRWKSHHLTLPFHVWYFLYKLGLSIVVVFEGGGAGRGGGRGICMICMTDLLFFSQVHVLLYRLFSAKCQVLPLLDPEFFLFFFYF